MKTEQPNTVKLSTGSTYTVQPVSETTINLVRAAVKRRLEAEGVPLSPPVYTITTLGGTETAAHDETTLQTEEDKRAWTNYQLGLKRLAKEQDEAQMKVWLMALDFDMPEDDGWKAKQRFLGIEIPEDPMELRYHYLTTEILRTAEDLLTVIGGVTKASYHGVIQEEDLDAALNSFRHTLQGRPARKQKDKAGAVEPQSGAAGA